MNPLLLATVSVTGIGLVVGLVLSIASELLKVEGNPLADEIEAMLPGINCGACGYSGCAGYAAAMASGNEQNVSLCSPGGQAVATALGARLGQDTSVGEQMTAVVRCQGDRSATHNRLSYQGIKSCRMASQLLGGPGECRDGCMAFGDCAAVCPYGAIRIENELAVIDPRLCRQCQMCISVCPKGLITMVTLERQTAVVGCRNRERGAVARTQCNKACIACQLCVRNCPTNAIVMDNNRAVIDPDKCINCGKCVEVCPTNAIFNHPVDNVIKLGEPKVQDVKQSA